MVKVCIAGSYPSGTVETFREVLPADKFQLIVADTQERFDAVTDADAVVLRGFKMPVPEVFDRFTNLKMVMRWGVGYDNVDIETAGRRGIAVCNTPGANAYAVAELAVGLMIGVGRNVTGYFQHIKEGNWDRGAFPVNLSLNHKKVGLLGGGNIGRQVARRVQAFGAEVQYYDTFRLKPEMEDEFRMAYVDLDTLFKTSDVVSVHVPLMDSTRHIVGREQMAMMKKGALLINTARGGLVDDAALLEALEAGRLGGAGLDCVEDEAGEATRALCARENVIITPHIGGTASDLGTAMIPMIVKNLTALEAGEPLSFVVNKEFLAC